MPNLSEYYPEDPALQPPAPPEQAAAPVYDESAPAPQEATFTGGNLSNYYPQETAPAAAPVQSTQGSSNLANYFPQGADTAAPQPTSQEPVDKGYVPGTNAVIDTMYGVGNVIGGAVEAVGGKDLRQNLEGAAPPIKEIAEADGIKDKLFTVAGMWQRPGDESTKRLGQDAVARLDGQSAPKESYNILSPEGLVTAGQQFLDEAANAIQHPEDPLYSLAEDVAESGAFDDQGITDVLGQVKDDPTKVDDFLTGQLRPSEGAQTVEQDEEPFYTWAANNPDRVEANRDTPENLWGEYLTSIGATSDQGLTGIGKGIVLGAGTDPTLVPSLVLTKGASLAAKGLTAANKVGAARGVLMTETAVNTALGGPEDVALGIAGKGLSSLVPQPIKSIFQPGEEAQRGIGAQINREVGTDVANTRQAAGFPANRLGTPFQTTPFTPTDFGPRKRPSTSVWEITPGKGITRDGNVPTIDDLRDVRAELLDMRPGEVHGFDQADLVGLAPTDPRFRLAMMRGALTQGITRTKAGKVVKTPFMVDDFPLNFKGASNPAAHRYTEFLAERIRRYGDEEVEAILRNLNNTKYRGKRNQAQPVEMYYDSMRQLVANALVKAKYNKPVDLGVTHRMDPATGTYKPHPKRLVINPRAAGKPLNIDDFEPDPVLWAKIQASAHPVSRITTPPPARTASPVNNAPPPPITTTGWKLPFTRKKPSAWDLSDSLDEFDGLAVADGHIPYLRQKVGDKTFYRTIADEQDGVYRMLDLAQGRAMGAPDELDKLVTKYTADYRKLYGNDVEPDFTRMGTFEANEFAATVATQRWLDALPPLKRKDATGLLGGIKKLSSDIGSFRSATGLYNWAAAPRQTIVQHTGNVFALLLTKPSAVTGMFNPKTAKAYFDAARVARKGLAPGQRVHSSTLDAMQKMGLGTNAMVADSGKNIVQRGQSIGASGRREDFDSFLGGPMRAVKKIWAPDAIGDFVAIPDGMFRDSIIRDFTPKVRRMQQAYPKEAASLAQDWVRAKGLKVPPAEVNKVVEKAFKTHFDADSRVSTINMTELENAIFDAFKHLPDQATTRNFANRVARDYKTKLNNQYQSTAAEAKKIAFSWDYNRLDDALKHVFLYHYWASRATGLYAKQLLKNPWIAASYARLAIALNEEAEANNYPAWMQNFSKILSSPAGSIMMANPVNLFGAMGIMADWEYGLEPERFGSDITELGRYRGIAPAMIHPGVDSLAWLFGLYGGEDAPTPLELTGLEKIPKMAIDTINLMNLNGQLPEGVLRDPNGNPMLLGNKPLSEIWQRILSGASGVVRENPQPIKDLYASQSTRTQANLEYILITENPEWSTDQVATELSRILNEAETEVQHDPRLNEAQLMTLQQDLQGPEFQSLPPGLRELFGGFLRNVSPIQIINRPELAMAARATPILPLGRNPMTLPTGDDAYDTYDISGGIYDTPDMQAWDKLEESWWPTPEVKEASEKRKAIIDATNPNGEIVNGVHYSQQQIMDMTDDRRYRLAEEAMNELGVTEEQRQQAFEQQRFLEENNPMLQQFRGYLDAMEAHPGGLHGFVDEMYAKEPAFARAMDRSGKEPGTEDWYQAAEWPETFAAATGMRTSHYDAMELPQGMDMSAYGTQRAESQAAYEENDYNAKLERSVNEAILAQKLLEREYPGYGFQVGSGNLDPDVWAHMREVWKDAGIDTTYITKTSHYGAQYVAWRLNNPGLEDTSFQAYRSATMTDDGSNKFADGTVPSAESSELETFDLDGPVDMALLSETFKLPQPTSQPSGQLVYNSANVDLRQTPGGSRLTVLAPKTPLRLLERSGDWALVSGPGGWEGWVPTISLLTAA